MEKIIVILGPTATGKTDLAIKLAKRFNGEVVSADSRQIYREMDIATAKPAQAQSAKRKAKNNHYLINGISQHLVDIIRPNQKFNAALYKELALKAIRNIQKRGKIPFLVGGTGLYIKAVVDNLNFPKVIPSQKLRKTLEAKTEKGLFRLYKKLDPKGARLIDKNNKRRLVRALEVCYLTKEPFWQQRKKEKPLFDVLQLGIKVPKKTLKKRISSRIERMFDQGLEKEARRLFKKYGDLPLFRQTIGYQEWLPLTKGKINQKTRVGIKNKMKNHTWQYARRQTVWFKKDPRIVWLPNRNPDKKAKKLIKSFVSQF
jgi:tRNA dimethylallyltransferase